MESLLPEIQNLVNEIALKNNIKNFTVDLNNAVSKEGDGYVGVLNGLNIVDKDSNKKLSFVLKKAPTNENLRKQFPTRTAFLREIRLYDGVLPDFLRFQEEYNISNPFTAFTNLHGYIRDELKETLILENLKDQGYRLTNRQKPMDSHHLSLVVTEYGKFHAVSFAMKKLQPERFQKIKELIGADIMLEFRKNAPQLEEFFDNQSNIALDFFGPTLEAVQNRSAKTQEGIKKFSQNCFELMYSNAEKDDPNAVVSHEDCWSANLLFRYENEDNPEMPTKLCLIDWQMSSITTPVHDLSYFLFISAGKNDLENYKKYLQLYHRSLSDTLAAFRLNAEDVYSYETLEKDWKENAKIGVCMNLVMMQQSLTIGKAYDYDKIAKEGKSLFDPNERKLEVSELFKQRMGDLVDFVVEHDLI